MTPDMLSAGAKRPTSSAWKYLDRMRANGFDVDRWLCDGLVACSSRAPLPDKRSGLYLPTFQVSVSFNGARPNDEQVRSALADFGIEGAEEDNHSPGIARHFWLVDDGRARQPECECKTTEARVVEPDGYVWQKDRS